VEETTTGDARQRGAQRKREGSLFLGEHRHALDDKGRIVFPARLRDELGSHVVVQKGIESCLYVFPMAEWENEVARVTSLPTTEPRARRYRRFFFSQAQNERVDKQGRLTIPQAFREYARLSKEVVIAGIGSRVEIWDADAWDAQRSDSESSVEDFASDLGI
jgi:MraZ protein